VEIPVLKYVDILIGLALVMLLVSTVVLAVTQSVLNAGFARARHLRRGLARLIVHLEPSLMRQHADYLAKLVLRHPLVGQQTILDFVRDVQNDREIARAAKVQADPEVLPRVSPGAVVQREELAYLLIELAAGEGPLMDPMDTGTTPKTVADAQAALAKALQLSGVEDPAATLRAIRQKVVENERAHPDQPAARWRADAIADCATTDFIGKLHASFDSTMARVTDGFTSESKLWVSGMALIVAMAMQLDAFQLIKRLAIDDSYRDGLVAAAQKLPDNAASDERAKESLELLDSPAIDLLPRIATATPPWGAVGPYLPDRNAVPGVLFSWVLLSLGAPFWFDLLKNLLKLRSLLAKKDDEDRTQRNTAQPPVPPSNPVTTGGQSAALGEAGDLAATGALG